MNKKNTLEDFRNRFKPIFEAFIKSGGDINSLTRKDKMFADIYNYHLKDENGKNYGIAEKFKLLEIDRKVKVVKDVKQSLINEIEEYKKNGGSFHIERKQLPFHSRLHVYSNYLKKQGIFKTHEEIMHDLGYLEYSDLYYKCSGLKQINKYEDLEGFVDAYRENEKLNGYVLNVARSVIGVPLYILIALILNKKTEKYAIEVDYVDHVKYELTKYAQEFGSLEDLRANNTSLYNKFDYLVHNYSDGSEENFAKEEWLIIFGLGEYSHKFRGNNFEDLDIEDDMVSLKHRFGDKQISSKDIEKQTYNKILKKSIKMGIPVGDLFKMYEINYHSINSDRLSLIYVEKVPYLREMKKRRDELIDKKGITVENGYCKEQAFLARIAICKQVYAEFKDLIQEELMGKEESKDLHYNV